MVSLIGKRVRLRYLWKENHMFNMFGLRERISLNLFTEISSCMDALDIEFVLNHLDKKCRELWNPKGKKSIDY